MKQDHNTAKSRDEKQIKRAYKSPEIILYGNIREITHSVGATGTIDGGGVPSGMFKTKP